VNHLIAHPIAINKLYQNYKVLLGSLFSGR
jgi:hypothetical protein